MSDLRAVVDRIEGKMAVLLVGEEQYRIVVPRSFLPEDAEEGAVLNIRMETDAAATADARRRVQELIDRLSGGEDQ